jgi:uncharacterized protein (TIGR02145 family)
MIKKNCMTHHYYKIKTLFIPAFVFIFLLFSIKSLAQEYAIKYEADSVLQKGDTALIRIKEDIRGSIQWQESYAKEQWEDIEGENTNELLREINDTTFFRAKITEESCEKPLYSEVVKINTMKISPKTIFIDTTSTYLVSDTFEIANGTYKYTGDTDLGITENSVIVGYKYAGYVKKVNSISYNGDTLILETQSGRISDVFDYYNVKDSLHLWLSEEDVKKTDTKGKVIKGEVDIQRKGISLKKKGSGFDFNNLVLFNGTVDNTDLKITITEGEINFKPAFTDHFDITPFRVKYIWLTAHGNLEMNMNIEVQASNMIEYSKKIDNVMKPITFPFLIGGVPVNIEISLAAGFDAAVTTSGTFTTGFYTNQSLEFGARYYYDANPQWKSIWNKGGTFDEKPLEMSNVSGEVNAKVYMEPAISFNVGWDPFSKKDKHDQKEDSTITKVSTEADTTKQDKFIEFGPYLAVSPYLRYNGVIDADGWEYGIYGGVEGKLGFDVSAIGYNIADFDTTLAQWEHEIVSGSSPVADFSVDSTDIEPGSTVEFTDQSTGNPESWEWNFGDGETSTEQNPSHTYNSEGVYDVSLTVNGSFGSNMEKKDNFITVRETGSFTDTRDGQVYEWVKIGDQVWMAENLNYDQDSYGNDWCYDNNSLNCDTYGRLYDWNAVMQGESSSNSNPSGVQGVCPDGWHVPSVDEWTELENYVSNDGHSGSVGTALKSTSGWNDNGNGTDDYGFSGLPGGYRDYNGNFDDVGGSGFWWSAADISASSAWSRFLLYFKEYFGWDNCSKDYGFSVRCLRD